MINSSISFDGGNSFTPTADLYLTYLESDSRFGPDHSSFESSKYPEEPREHIIPLASPSPFDYKVKFALTPPAWEAIGSLPLNLLTGTNQGPDGWAVNAVKFGIPETRYRFGTHLAIDRDHSSARAMVVTRTYDPPQSASITSGFETLTFDIDPAIIRSGQHYTLSFSLWSTNSPQINLDVYVANVDSTNRLTSYSGVRSLCNGLNTVTLQLDGIADGVSGGTQKIIFAISGAVFQWKSFEIWNLKLSSGHFDYLPYTPNPADIPTVADIVNDFNSRIAQPLDGLLSIRQIHFHNPYKHHTIVGYPYPLAMADDFHAQRIHAAGQSATVELTIHVPDPSLCSWAAATPASIASASVSDDI